VPLTPPCLRVSYTAVRQVSALSLFTPTMPLSLFKKWLANSKFRPPYRIRDNPTYIPSSRRWRDYYGLPACQSLVRRAGADFSPLPHVDDEASPGKSFFLLPIPVASTYLSFWCSLGFTKMCLLTRTNMPHMRRTGCNFAVTASPTCSSVQTFAVVFAHLSIVNTLQCIPLGKPPCHLLILRTRLRV